MSMSECPCQLSISVADQGRRPHAPGPPGKGDPVHHRPVRSWVTINMWEGYPTHRHVINRHREEGVVSLEAQDVVGVYVGLGGHLGFAGVVPGVELRVDLVSVAPRTLVFHVVAVVPEGCL